MITEQAEKADHLKLVVVGVVALRTLERCALISCSSLAGGLCEHGPSILLCITNWIHAITAGVTDLRRYWALCGTVI